MAMPKKLLRDELVVEEEWRNSLPKKLPAKENSRLEKSKLFTSFSYTPDIFMIRSADYLQEKQIRFGDYVK